MIALDFFAFSTSECQHLKLSESELLSFMSLHLSCIVNNADTETWRSSVLGIKWGMKKVVFPITNENLTNVLVKKNIS